MKLTDIVNGEKIGPAIKSNHYSTALIMNGCLVIVLACLLLLLGNDFSQAAVGDRQNTFAEELEKLPKDTLEIQRKWDELRKGYAEAMFELRFGGAEQKVIEKLNVLFQKGATIDTFNDEALETAVFYRANQLAKYLLAKGADPNGFRSDGKPLKVATKYSDVEAIKLLKEYRAEPLKPTEAAQLKLSFAGGTGNLNEIKNELANGADLNSQDSLDHETALIQAAQFGRVEAVKLLLRLGAEPNRSGYFSAIDVFAPDFTQTRAARSPRGMCTALHAATVHGGFPEIVQLLLKAGAPVSSTNCYMNLTPLHVAAKFNSVRTATVLLKEGAKVMSKDSDGKTPLDYTESGPMIKLLKNFGAREIR